MWAPAQMLVDRYRQVVAAEHHRQAVAAADRMLDPYGRHRQRPPAAPAPAVEHYLQPSAC